MLRVLKFTLIIIGFVATQRICHRATDGFALPKIQSNLTYNPDWEVQVLDPQSEVEIRALLTQSFRYLGRGAQAYAFVSEDGRTVLKFFRHHRMHTLLCHGAFLLPMGLRKQLQQTIDKRKAKLHKDFNSYKLAYRTLKEETGLLFVHLNKTHHLGIQLKLFDKIGVQHQIDLDKMEFVLQKRADLLYPALNSWIEQGNLTQAKTSLSELIALLKSRCQKGLFDKDPDLRTNFGFIDGHPIQFDIGRFKEDLTRQDPRVYKDEIVRITDRLMIWLAKHSPELAEHLQNEIQVL